MAIAVTRLTPCFAARIDGADITRPLDDTTWAAIRAAFEEHSVLLFRGQPLDDEQPDRVQPPLRRARGHPQHEPGRGHALRAPVEPRHQDRARSSRRATGGWSTSSPTCSGTATARSSRSPRSARCSPARIVPPAGGATEFASARAAYPSLPEALQRRAETLVVVHDFSWSRDQVRPGFFTAEERAVYPPVRHPLVRVNPVNGRPALFLGAHASHVEGLPIDEGRALLRTLLDHVTQPAVRLPARVAGRRPGGLGQPLRAPSRDALRHHAPQAAHAAHHRLRGPGGAMIDYKTLVQDDRIHASLYTDPRIFDDEMERIFHRGWVFVGHASEIPRAGRLRHPPPRHRAGHHGARQATARSSSSSTAACTAAPWSAPAERGHARGPSPAPTTAGPTTSRGELLGVPYPGGYAALRQERARPDRARRAWPSYRGFVFASLRADRHLARRAPRPRHPADRPLVRSLAGGRGRADGGLGEAPLRGQLEDAARERQRRLPPRLRAPRAVQDVRTQYQRVVGDERSIKAVVRDWGHGHIEIDWSPGYQGAVRVVRRRLGPGGRRLRGRAGAPRRPRGGAAAHHARARPTPSSSPTCSSARPTSRSCSR